MSSTAFAQATGDKEAAAILELGGAISRSLTESTTTAGPNVALEVTPVENWLELEIGVTPLFHRRHLTEWSTDVLFKKPWNLSRHVEFMAGAGPEWVHANEAGVKRNSLAGEAVLDFMFWPGTQHKFGWFVEPAYEYNFARTHECALGFTAGLLIAIR